MTKEIYKKIKKCLKLLFTSSWRALVALIVSLSGRFDPEKIDFFIRVNNIPNYVLQYLSNNRLNKDQRIFRFGFDPLAKESFKQSTNTDSQDIANF